MISYCLADKFSPYCKMTSNKLIQKPKNNEKMTIFHFPANLPVNEKVKEIHVSLWSFTC